MTVKTQEPQAFASYVSPNGHLTTEGQILILRQHQAIVELQAAAADFETRIAALEA